MIVSKAEALDIVSGCRKVSTRKTNGYSGKELCEIVPYAGRFGAGYAITQDKTTEYWSYPANVVSKSVYNGNYSVKSECMTANNVPHVRYNDVLIVPSWQLELDTLTGKATIKQTEESLKSIRLAGHTLTVMWRGSMQEIILRRKIRRKLKALLRSGNAIFYNKNAKETY